MLVTMCGWETQEETLTPGDTPPSVLPTARSGTLGKTVNDLQNIAQFCVLLSVQSKRADSFLKHINEISGSEMLVQITVF